MGFFSSQIPPMRFLMLNEEQQRAVNAVVFGNNHLLIAEDEKGDSFIDMSIDSNLLIEGLKFLCERDPELLDRMTNLVIDLHTDKK